MAPTCVLPCETELRLKSESTDHEERGTAVPDVRPADESWFEGAPVMHGISWQYEIGQDNPTVIQYARWAVCIFRDPQDPEGWYTAELTGFHGLAAEGETHDDAVAAMHDMLKLAFEGEAVELTPREERYRIPENGRVLYLTVQ